MSTGKAILWRRAEWLSITNALSPQVTGYSG